MSEPLARARRVVAVGAATLVVVLVALAAAAWRLVEAEEAAVAVRGRSAATAAAEDLVRALAVEGEARNSPKVWVSSSGELRSPTPTAFAPTPPLADSEGAFFIRAAGELGPTLGRAALRQALRSNDRSTQIAAAAEGTRLELRERTGQERDWANAIPRAGRGRATRDSCLLEAVDPPRGIWTMEGQEAPSYRGIQSDAVLSVGTSDEMEILAMIAALCPPYVRSETLRDVDARRRELSDARVLAEGFRHATDVDGRFRAALLEDGDAVTGKPRDAASWQIVRLRSKFVQEVVRRVLDPRAMRLVHAEASSLPAAVDAPGAAGWAIAASFSESEVRSRSTLLLAGLGVAGLAAVVAFAAFARSVGRDARLATLRTEFVATVSHELRTPVAVVRTSAETLASGRATRDEDKQALTEAIVRELERLSTLLGNVLDFARMESGRRTYALADFDLEALVRDVAARHAGVTVGVVKPLPLLRCDADALSGAVGNLLDNARKYSEPGARCVLRVSTTDGNVVLEVIDHGIGVPDAEKQHVFERFFRGADPRVRETRGAGIGLALVQHAAQAHGGRVEIVDTPGGGATFRIVLPMTQNGDA